ncbi:inclusion membrane protein GarD [Chlamydia vaughanii]|uniref:inclusion membrane protein GarD n=1 Tax=Chlamydia vaughanii TaxID=3112552 RepID=UPI0032B1BDE2
MTASTTAYQNSCNAHVLSFFRHATEDDGSLYGISTVSRGPLDPLVRERQVSNLTINNLLLVNKITSFSTAPLAQISSIAAFAPSPSTHLRSLFKKRERISRSSSLNILSRLNDDGSQETPQKIVYLSCWACWKDFISCMVNATVGSFIHNIITIGSLIKRILRLKREEKEIVLFLKKNSGLSPYERGSYIASASAAYHSRQAAYRMLAEKIAGSAIFIIYFLTLIAFIVATVLLFQVQTYGAGVFTITFSVTTFLMLPKVNNLADNGIALFSGIGGMLMGLLFMAPSVFSGLAIFISGMIQMISALIALWLTHTRRCSRNKAVDSMHQSLLSLRISEQLKNPQSRDILAQQVAMRCLTPYTHLLCPNTFPKYNPKKDSEENIALQKRYQYQIYTPLTSLPDFSPPQTIFPPADTPPSYRDTISSPVIYPEDSPPSYEYVLRTSNQEQVNQNNQTN